MIIQGIKTEEGKREIIWEPHLGKSVSYCHKNKYKYCWKHNDNIGMSDTIADSIEDALEQIID